MNADLGLTLEKIEFSSILGALSGNQVASTIVLVLAAIIVRGLLYRYLAKRDSLANEERRLLMSNIRNALFLVVVSGVVLIGAPALRTFALSLTAFVIAIIIATKELILCLTGTLLKISSGSLKIGDWVEINGLRGEVVDQTVLTTSIQELGKDSTAYEFTGRTVTIPNSLFLTATVVNEQFFKHYVFHTFYLITAPQIDIAPIEEAMKATVEEEMKPFMDVAKRYHTLIQKKAGIEIKATTPQAKVSFLNDGKLKLSITAFLPTDESGRIEQLALRRGLQTYQSMAAVPEKESA